MSLSWEDSYLGQIRTLAGDERTLILVGARCIIRDETGRLLLIKRSDNGFWALPAGAMELGESITDCAVREVREETGLIATATTLCALYSSPENTNTNMYGHTYQQFSALFRIDAYEGELQRVTDETTDAGFFGPGEFPEPTGKSVRRSLDDLEAFERTGTVVLG